LIIVEDSGRDKAQTNTRNIAVKDKFNLSAPHRCIRKGELLFHAFLTSTLNGNE